MINNKINAKIAPLEPVEIMKKSVKPKSVSRKDFLILFFSEKIKKITNGKRNNKLNPVTLRFDEKPSKSLVLPGGLPKSYIDTN